VSRRVAPGWLVLIGLWLHQVAIAFLSPLSAEDWTMRLDGPQWPAANELFHDLIVHSRIAHVLLTPLAVVALPLGLATLARGRRLRLRELDDAILLLVIASLLWLVIPHFGLDCSFRRLVAIYVVSLAGATWFVIGFRALAAGASGASPSTPIVIAVGAAALAVGSSTRPIAIATLVVCALIARRAGVVRRRWAMVGLIALAVGSAATFTPEMWRALGQFAQRGFDGNLRYLNTHLRVPAWVGSSSALREAHPYRHRYLFHLCRSSCTGWRRSV